VPGVYAVVLWIFPLCWPLIAMVKEKDKGTILQVYASGSAPSELLLGKSPGLPAGGGLSGWLWWLNGWAVDLPTQGFAATKPLLWAPRCICGGGAVSGCYWGCAAANQNSAGAGCRCWFLSPCCSRASFIRAAIFRAAALVSALDPQRDIFIVNQP